MAKDVQVKSMKKIKILLFIMVTIVFVALLCFLFAGENFIVLKEIFRSGATKDEIQQSIGKLGLRAYIVVFVLSMIQVVLTFIPAEPLHVVSGISFGLGRGLAVCLLGILVGNTIIYLLYKVFGKKLTDFFAANVDFDFSVAQKSKKIALIVIILYCLPAIPYGLICFFAASMGIKYPKYILITGIGSIPSLILDVGLGHITMATSWAVSISIFFVIIVLLIIMFKYKAQIFEKVNEYVKKSQEKERNKVGNYNTLLFNLASGAVCASITRKVKIKLKNNVGKLSKPCIVLCNHGSFYDFVYSGMLIKKYKPHFIVARMYFHHKLLGKVISSSGAFPKSMFVADVENSKNCLKVIASKGMLAMMPEARLSTIGTFEGIQDTTYKFIQKMQVPVYVVKINGSYLAKPKWGDKVRKGSLVEGELNLLLSQEKIKTLSLDEIKTKIDQSLCYDEWEWLKQHPEISYKHKTLAKGLENILSLCPQCNSKYSLVTDKNNIKCEKCDAVISIDNRYTLSGTKFDNIKDWYLWQKDVLKQEIESNPDFCLKSNVELKHLSKDGKRCTRPAGSGYCVLNRDGLLYVGTEDGNNIEKMFPISQIYRILFGAGEDFEIYEGKELYYFVPEDTRSCVTWYLASEILKEINKN